MPNVVQYFFISSISYASPSDLHRICIENFRSKSIEEPNKLHEIDKPFSNQALVIKLSLENSSIVLVNAINILLSALLFTFIPLNKFWYLQYNYPITIFKSQCSSPSSLAYSSNNFINNSSLL